MAGIENFRPPDLNNILEEHELDQLSGVVKEKIQSVLKSRTIQYEDLKVKHERLSVTSEQRQLEVESQLGDTRNKVERLVAENAQLKKDWTETDEKFRAAAEKLKSVQDIENSSLTTQLCLTKANETLESEKRDLTVLLEKRSREIERLNEEWNSLSDKLSQANREKYEAQAQVSDFQSQIVTSQCTQKKLTEEKEALQRQIDLLNKDLSNKSQQLFNVRKEQSARNLDLQSRLEEQSDENQHLLNTVETMRNTNAEQVKKIEQYMEKLQDAHNNQVQADEQFRQELEANQKLADLYKGQATDLEEKCKELMTAVKELRILLKDASTSYTELQNQHQTDLEQLKVEVADRDNQIQNLSKELENANELIDEIKKKAATSEHVETLFPNAAATSRLVNSGMSLTQIYNEYMQASENLYLEKEETKRLNTCIDTILQEIEEKAPLIRKQREDYEQSLETIEQMNKQLDAALLESQSTRIEADQANRNYNYMKRENQKLQQQTEDLSKQVQYLVKEIEEVKSGRIVREEDISYGNISSTTSADVISGHLVTFRDIQDLQHQNQMLLQVVRDLSEKKEEEESLAAEEKTKDLKDQLERSLSEMQELKSARDRQATMVESIVRQRDYYRSLLQQKEDGYGQVLEMTTSAINTPLKSPIAKSPLKSPAPDRALEEAKAAFKLCQEEFERYKTEMREQVKMLNEDVRDKESKISELRRQNMKLSSQLENGVEKSKILMGNAEGYKRELASLREKEKKLFSSVAKHEQTINTLRQDLLSTQEKFSRAEAQCHHLNTEKELLKSSEQRLLLDIDNIRREKTSQSMLMANLQSIQNTLDHSEKEMKSRYTNQIEKLEMELTAARRNLTATRDEHKAVVQLWENQTKQLRQQLEGEMKSHENTKKNHQNTCHLLEAIKEQLKTTEADLAEARRRAERSTLRTDGLQTAPVTPSSNAPLSNTEEVKTLKYQVTETKREIQNLKEQLERSKQHVTEYKSMADNLQKALTEQSECTKQFEEQLKRECREKDSVLERLKSTEGESQKQMEDVMKGLDEQHKLNGDLRKQLATLQQELEDAVFTRDSALAQEAASREECSQQVQMASEAKDKYQRELMLHAADVEALGAVKKQVEGFNSKFATEQEFRLKAEKELEEGKNSWAEQEKILKEEYQRLEKRNEELSSQNAILHQQMEKMSNEVMSIQRAVTRSGSPQKQADLSFDEETSRSTEQLQEVIRFLRKEKEIAQSKLEIVQTECNNVKHRYKRLQKELEEARKTLTEQQIEAQASVQTASQHADLMRKVENLNILTDSNKLLREEKNRLEQLTQELEAKVSTLEGSINPLQSSQRDLTAEKETLIIERDTLKNEVDRWKSRANRLIEQANRTDPDEHKKIVQERDALKLRVKHLMDESIKNNQEKEKLTRDVKTANDEQTRVKKSLQDVTKTMQELTNRNSSLQQELNQARNNASSKEKEIFQLKNTLSEKETELTQTVNRVSEKENEIQGLKEQVEEKVRDSDEKAKTINQLRKIGRKYKDQAEAFNKQLEELKTKTETEQATPPVQEGVTVTQAEVDQQVGAIKEQLTQLEKERDDLKVKLEAQSGEFGGAKMQLSQIQQENTQLKTEIEQLKNKNVEYEQKQNQSKSVLQAVKKKISSQNEEINKLTAEINDLKQKLSTSEQPSGATEEAESRLTAMKSTFENRISNLTKEVSDNSHQVKTLTAEVAEKTKQVEQLSTERAELQEKIAAMQKQIDAQPKPVAPQPQTARSPATVTVERARPVDRSSAPVVESPKTANIKPMSTSPAAVRPQAPPIQSQMAGSRVIANIRPMAIAPTNISPLAVSVPTPTATVMPTTVSQHDTTDSNEVTQAQLSPVMTSRPTQQVQRVTPQVEASSDASTPAGGLIIQEVPSIQEQTVTQSEPEVSAPSDNSDNQSTSGATVREVTPSTSASTVPREVIPVTSVAPGAKDTTSVPSVSREGQSLGKRSREEAEGQSEEIEPKRTKVSTAQGSPIPAITVTDEHANTLTVTEEQPAQEPEKDNAEVPPPQLTVQESETSLGQSESTESTNMMEDLSSQATHSDSLAQQNVEEIEEEEEEEEEEEIEEEEGEPAIIILSEDEEEENEEDEEVDEEEEEDIGEDEDYNEDDEMEGEYTSSQLEEIQAETQPEDDDVIQLDDDSNDRQMEAQEEDVSQTTQPPSSASSASVLFGQRMPFNIERQTSMNRQLAPFILGGQTGTFEEGEDGIVPSTPTLFVPNRGDGYAEVVSSPRISNQRFTFAALSESSLAQPELGELASQGALGGMESTSMDLSELDEGTGRSVPSTPLRTTAPVTMISEAAIASALTPLANTTSSSGETNPTQPSTEGTEGQVEVIVEEQGEQAETVPTSELTEGTEPRASVSAGETTGDTTEQEKESESTPKDEEANTSQEKTETTEKPKIQPIVWEGPSPTTIQQSRGRPINTRGAPQRGQLQNRGSRGGMFQRGRGLIQRSRGPGRGNRGGPYRSPNMY
ncbi:nucleoprotein TPR-like isoform X2 [Ostrea edulis]|uniref:nucleoprotein TPR-like isoform X2 n=2 Tax=Ostrea edulis TaxID=37623 RepID=UPI0024AF754B|nr:nucleoprotein TPR-like isoform X2 [Ostrea edulis]